MSIPAGSSGAVAGSGPTASAPDSGPATGGAGASSKDAALKRECAQLEGVFLQQLLKVMRQTVPHEGVLDGGQGESMFTDMMDQKVADSAATQMQRGLGLALYHQLRHAAEEIQ